MWHGGSRPALWAAVAAFAGLGLALSACGSASSSSPASPATSPAATPAGTPQADAAVCHDIAALRASLDNLKHLTLNKGAVNQLAADLKDVQAKASALAGDLSKQGSAQLGALKTALTTLQHSVSGLGNGSSSITAVAAALGGVTTAAQGAVTSLSRRCPSLSS